MGEPSQGRSLPWFRVDVDLVDHPKVLALADALDCAEAEAGWLVIRLWAWTMRYAARGRLAPGARPALERLWTGAGTAPESGSAVDALVRAGFLDAAADGGWEVHDWDEHNGAAVAKAEKDAERKRAARARRSNGRGQSADGRADGAGNGTGRDGTEQTTTIVEDKPRPVGVVLEETLTTDELDVWECWRVECRHPKAVLTRARLKLIRQWLPVYGVTRLQRAIRGCSRSPHHQGKNDRNTRYDSLELILRDAKHIEDFEVMP